MHTAPDSIMYPFRQEPFGFVGTTQELSTETACLSFRHIHGNKALGQQFIEDDVPLEHCPLSRTQLPT